MNRLLAFFVAGALCLIATSEAVGVRAAEGPTYQIDTFKQWDTSNIDVLIIPPKHGQIFNENGALNGGDPAEATPFNSYLDAIEAGIVEWDKAIAMFAPDWLRENLQTNPYVVGRDSIPPAAISDPEIVITAGEHKGHILGVAISPGKTHCLIDNSMFFTMSFSYEDMYNVGTHEFGHCLGSGHVLTPQPTHDVMFPSYSDPVGASDNHMHCVSNLDVKTLEWAYGDLFGHPMPRGPLSVPASEYATTCSQPVTPAQPISGQPTPTGQPPSSQPTPSETPSQEPSSEPEPEPSNSPPPQEPREDVFRSVRLNLKRHLVARGYVEASEDGSGCLSDVGVTIRRLRDGVWRKVTTVTSDGSGWFRARLADRPGRYRAEIQRDVLPDGRGCTAATSPVARHRH